MDIEHLAREAFGSNCHELDKLIMAQFIKGLTSKAMRIKFTMDTPINSIQMIASAIKLEKALIEEENSAKPIVKSSSTNNLNYANSNANFTSNAYNNNNQQQDHHYNNSNSRYTTRTYTNNNKYNQQPSYNHNPNFNNQLNHTSITSSQSIGNYDKNNHHFNTNNNNNALISNPSSYQQLLANNNTNKNTTNTSTFQPSSPSPTSQSK